jgi:hypothetical protein
MGNDGNLYIAEWGDGDTIDPRISRYDLANNALTVVTTLDYATQSNPSSLAFRPASHGGQMLVGRLGAGPVLVVSDWNGNAATVANFTTGLSLDGALGLAVAPNGTLYVSDSKYTYSPSLGYPVAFGPIVSFDSTGAFSATVAADGSASGTIEDDAGSALGPAEEAGEARGSIENAGAVAGADGADDNSVVHWMQIGPVPPSSTISRTSTCIARMPIPMLLGRCTLADTE